MLAPDIAFLHNADSTNRQFHMEPLAVVLLIIGSLLCGVLFCIVVGLSAKRH
jgi:hypothetical protein